MTLHTVASKSDTSGESFQITIASVRLTTLSFPSCRAATGDQGPFSDCISSFPKSSWIAQGREAITASSLSCQTRPGNEINSDAASRASPDASGSAIGDMIGSLHWRRSLVDLAVDNDRSQHLPNSGHDNNGMAAPTTTTVQVHTTLRGSLPG